MLWMTFLSFVVVLVIGTIVVHVSARFADIENATLMKAFVVALLGAFLSLIFGSIPIFSILIIGIAIMVLFRLVYLTTWPKAFVAAIVYVIVSWVVRFFFNALVM